MSFKIFQRLNLSLVFDQSIRCKILSSWTRTMHEAAQLSGLIGQIYEAALDSELWPSVLAQAAEFVRGSAAGLFWKDVSRGDYIFTFGLDRRCVKFYFEKFAKLDRVSTGHLLPPIEAPADPRDLVPYDEFLNTRAPVCHQRFVDCVTAVLDKSATSAAILGIFRDERDGIADENMRRRMHLIVPHMRRAVIVAKTLGLKSTQAASFADALDGIAAALFLVDAASRIVHANVAARALLDRSVIFRAVGRRLIATDRKANRAFADAFAAAGNGDAAIGATGVTLALVTHSGERYVARALPLTAGTRRRVENKDCAVAALFVYPTAPSAVSCSGAIVETYKLTPTELRVLLAIVEVGGIPVVAKALGVGTETVRTHLRRIFEKTGASRQLDLAKIVGRFSNPLVG